MTTTSTFDRVTAELIANGQVGPRPAPAPRYTAASVLAVLPLPVDRAERLARLLSDWTSIDDAVSSTCPSTGYRGPDSLRSDVWAYRAAVSVNADRWAAQ